MTETLVKRWSSRLANGVSRRSILGRGLGAVATVATGVALPATLPAAHAKAAPPGPLTHCSLQTCPAGTRLNRFGSCWLECIDGCCSGRAIWACDCCYGSNCSPNYFCTNPGCTLGPEIRYTCHPNILC